MGSLLGVSAPKEDPAVAAARKQQQAQADAQYTQDAQTDLLRRTRARMAIYGFGPPTAPATAAPPGGTFGLGSFAKLGTMSAGIGFTR